MCERVESVIFRIHQYVEEEKEDWAKQKTQKKTKKQKFGEGRPALNAARTNQIRRHGKLDSSCHSGMISSVITWW
jgi:hypothetical protein